MTNPNVIHSKGTNIDYQTKNNLQIDPAKRIQMIQLSAYFRAQKRGFTPNQDLADWFDSEREVDRHLCSFSC